MQCILKDISVERMHTSFQYTRRHTYPHTFSHTHTGSLELTSACWKPDLKMRGWAATNCREGLGAGVGGGVDCGTVPRIGNCCFLPPPPLAVWFWLCWYRKTGCIQGMRPWSTDDEDEKSVSNIDPCWSLNIKIFVIPLIKSRKKCINIVDDDKGLPLFEYNVLQRW